jgi:hypothetical protein
MRNVQVVLYNDNNKDRLNRFQALMNRKPHPALVNWASCNNTNIAPCFTKTQNGLQFEVVNPPAYVFYAELSGGNYFLYRVASGDLSDQQIVQLIQEASVAKVVNYTPAQPGEAGNKPSKKEGDGTGGNGTGDGNGGKCLLPTWLTFGKCITVPVWIWLVPVAYATIKIVDAQKNSGRLIWGGAAGYSLYQYIKGVTQKK